VRLSPAGLRDWGRSEEGRKAIRYTLVSVISVAVSQLAFVLVFGVFEVFGARGSSIFATCVGAVPSYYLNRNWAWGQTGRSHLWKEVVPFWVLAFVGLVFSTWAADFAHTHATAIRNHAEHVAVVSACYLGAFGVLWVAKFLIFNELMWRDRRHSAAASAQAAATSTATVASGPARRTAS